MHYAAIKSLIIKTYIYNELLMFSSCLYAQAGYIHQTDSLDCTKSHTLKPHQRMPHKSMSFASGLGEAAVVELMRTNACCCWPLMKRRCCWASSEHPWYLGRRWSQPRWKRGSPCTPWHSADAACMHACHITIMCVQFVMIIQMEDGGNNIIMVGLISITLYSMIDVDMIVMARQDVFSISPGCVSRRFT